MPVRSTRSKKATATRWRPDPKVSAYITGLPEPQRTICRRLREIVAEVASSADERWAWSRAVYRLDGAMFCHIVANRDDVNIGFNRGASLDDPDGLLRGTGKGMRHYKMKRVEDVRVTRIRAWVREGLRLARE